MGQNAHPGRSQRALISIDWMLLTVAVIVLLFCFSAFIRISADPDPARQQGGLFALTSSDDLLAFQDFSFGSDGWAPADTTDRLAGLGPVLGPFVDEEVTRAFQLPVDTHSVDIRFDLHLIGEWTSQDVITILVDGEEVVTLNRAETTEGSGVRSTWAEGTDFDINVVEAVISPRPAEPALPGATEEAFTSLTISLRTTDASDTLSLQLRAEAGAGVSWTLDNLAVVATTDGEA